MSQDLGRLQGTTMAHMKALGASTHQTFQFAGDDQGGMQLRHAAPLDHTE